MSDEPNGKRGWVLGILGAILLCLPIAMPTMPVLITGCCILIGLPLAGVGASMCLVTRSNKPEMQILAVSAIALATGLVSTLLASTGGWLMGFGEQPWYSPLCFVLGLPLMCIGVIGCLVAVAKLILRR